jgi:hypothetical protein
MRTVGRWPTVRNFMPQIAKESLLSLEAYARERPAFRSRVIEHKKHRTVHLGAHLTLIFEDELTIRYQVQEMLRIERIFEEEDIRAELDVYNPLVPDGGNWKATMMIEYEDSAERGRRLAELKGVEQRVWVRVEGFPPLYPIADEDLERENEQKTSSVHFLRFEVPEAVRAALRSGAGLAIGVDHPAYRAVLDPVPAEVRASLIGDLH